MNTGEQWSDYWQTDGSSAEVFVDKDGQKHPELALFWQQEFNHFQPGDRIVDIASGAGSVLANLPQKHSFKIFAQDISEIALKQQKERIQGVEIIASSADNIPVDSESFERVLSQFGVEYAGETAFIEAARLIAVGGTMTFLSHYRNGYIDSRNRNELKGIELVKDLDFIDKALKITQVMFNQQQQNGKVIVEQFTKVEPVLERYVRQHEQGVHAYLYNGFRQLISNRDQYQEKDIVGWLENMKKEFEKAEMRLKEMRKAALSKKQVKEIIRSLEENQMSDLSCDAITLTKGNLPVAWCLKGTKISK